MDHSWKLDDIINIQNDPMPIWVYYRCINCNLSKAEATSHNTNWNLLKYNSPVVYWKWADYIWGEFSIKTTGSFISCAESIMADVLK